MHIAYKDESNNGTWYVVFNYIDWTGERKRKKKRGFKTLREAKEYERNFLSEPAPNEDITFLQLYELYILDIDKKMKSTTLDTKKNIIEHHILPYFKNKKIKDITSANVRMWQNEIIKKGYSETYQRSINAQLSTIMNYAVKYYGLYYNPCQKAGLIGSKHADEMNFWTLEEFNKFIKCVSNVSYHCIFMLLYWTGIRKGELMALTLDDIVDHSIVINKTAAWKNGKLIITSPKTKNSKRTVELPDGCYKELINYVNQLYGIKGNDRIFDISSNGVLNKALERGIKKAGVPEIRIHDFRHSHASLCIELGMNVLAISKRLGHKNIETTLNTYSHLYPDSQKALAAELSKISSI